MSIKKFKGVFIVLLLFIISGCSIVRIDTKSIDNTVNVVLSKNNTLFNQVGQGYKYYVPGGVSYIDSDDFNDVLYCNGSYYYLYIDVISYYYQADINYTEDSDLYYSRKLTKEDGFYYDGYLAISEVNDKYYLEFMYNYAKIEAIVAKDELNNAVLNASYILSTIKYNHDIVELMLNDDYFTNKTGKYNDYNSKGDSTNFVLEKETEEG